ncbi:hypothetical protein [Pseudobacteroides cellulosolvens]|uniref:Transporter n=1 Tax=Pseudobacteroides cellulosolvens ATCC 35603 = DSM 2933 TaxID=398512 RepID=A0A0L6JSU1_9FIRM|nr:hypothetical protein [Pseudobacteroides cellulosolvens]KNY28883.1 hypothetical protein Bccel_4157 [Pseudobacteroides cellulosolvens ATCC 35603 = DSM 2933]
MYEYYNSLDRQPQEDGQQFGPPFGQGQQFGPPFGQPFGQGQQFGPPFGPPSMMQGGASRPPSGPPPSFVPQQSQTQGVGIFAVDPGAIRPCTFRYIYIWLNTGESFWAWLVYVGRRSAAGWRWTGFRWIYFGVDLRNIESFVCY